MESPKKKTSFHFNATAAIACFTFLVSLILLLVSAGMQSWATLTVSRGIYPNGTEQSYTHKTHGPIQRCVAYELRSKRFLYQDSSLVPQDSCIYLTDINCEKPSYSLASAHVLLETNELLNIDSPVRCNQMKHRLNTTFAFLMIGIIGTAIAALLSIPVYPTKVYVAAGFTGVASAVVIATSAGVFADTERDFSGFFSRNGLPYEGCLSHGFGLAVAAMAVNVFGSVGSFCALFSNKLWKACKECKLFKKKTDSL